MPPGCAVASIGPQRWPGFCRVIERDDLIDDPRFNVLLLAPAHRQELFALLDTIFPTKPTAEWVNRLRAEGQRFAPVRTHAEVAEDPQAFANGYLFRATHPAWGDVTVVGNPIRFSATPVHPAVVAPELGQHTEEVLLAYGFTRDDLAVLRAQGAFGPDSTLGEQA